jgi:hypothetical protein
MKNWRCRHEVRYGRAATVKNSMPAMANKSLWSIKTVTDPYEQPKCAMCMENSHWTSRPPQVNCGTRRTALARRCAALADHWLDIASAPRAALIGITKPRSRGSYANIRRLPPRRAACSQSTYARSRRCWSRGRCQYSSARPSGIPSSSHRRYARSRTVCSKLAFVSESPARLSP